jgi:ATP-dependent Clp protease protease subunit
MLYLESENPERDILFYINSPGGSVTDGLAILDTMKFVKCDVSTIVMGQACSMGSLLASSGTRGKRLMLPHARHLIHQPLGGAQGQASDIEIQANEILRMKRQLTEIYVENTGQDYDKLVQDMDRDNIMTAEQSIKYGLADLIVSKRS